jgi:hypothetical protein
MTLEKLNAKIKKLEAQRKAEIRKLRRTCEHLRLVEGKTYSQKPHRICIDCGAEEDDWYCGIHVLLIEGDTWSRRRTTIGDPRKKLGVLVAKDASDWHKYRISGADIYNVGQSSKGFKGGGIKTYAELTAQ